MKQLSSKVIRILAGLLLAAGVIALQYIHIEPVSSWIFSVENLAYDFAVRKMHRPLKAELPISIVDIDDKSLAAEGRWPWSREKMAQLVQQLYTDGATALALDLTFPEPEVNIAQVVLDQIEKTPAILLQFDQVKEKFDYDAHFASSLREGESILGIVFQDGKEKAGAPPKPLLPLRIEDQDLGLPDKAGYITNIAALQQAAKAEGFINAVPDPDGVLRTTPLLFRHDKGIFASLALEAATNYLMTDKIELVTKKYGEKPVLEGMRLDNLFIPTDPMGQILIPYRGNPYSFPYLSATDVLNGKANQEQIRNKLIFIGSTASALGDVRASSMTSVFPGIEVHATVASGIIDHYLPYKPAWGKGVAVLLMVVLGVIFAAILPFLGVFAMSFIALAVPLCLIIANYWLWSVHGIVISIFVPIGMLVLLYALNLVWGYLVETKKSKDLKSMFGQYVPTAYLDNMLKEGGEFNLDGESKELSVLFSDIRDFTTVSEGMSATELKQFINQYLTPITEVIFNHQGTIDKYVGDMVMAFWGAPLSDPKHAYNAVVTGLAMQARLSDLNDEFEREKKPRIKIGVGINTGMMNVGDMGSQFRRAYTVLGDSVNLASRLEGQNKIYKNEVLVGSRTYELTKNDFSYRKVDKIKVKGKAQAVEVYSPICFKKDETPEIKTELEAHHAALSDYFEEKWDMALKKFILLRDTYPKNKEIYTVYIENIQSRKK